MHAALAAACGGHVAVGSPTPCSLLSIFPLFATLTRAMSIWEITMECTLLTNPPHPDTSPPRPTQVTAQDKASGKVQKITITSDKGRLSEAEIERMVREAEENAEQDKQAKVKRAAFASTASAVSPPN